MKVLILSHMYPKYEGDTSGVFVHEQALEMRRQGIEVKVVCPVPYVPFGLNLVSQKYKEIRKQPKYREIEGVSVYYPRFIILPRLLRFHRSGESMGRGAIGVVSKLARQWGFDIIHAHTALPDGDAACIFAKQFDTSIVVTVHGADLQTDVIVREKTKRKIIRTLRNADQVVLVSSKLDRIQREIIGLPEEQVTVLNNGVDQQFVSDTPSLKSERETERPLRILSVSNLMEFKGVQTNLKAVACLVKKYPDLQYEIIGSGPYGSQLQSLARSLDLDRHVKFLGRINRSEVKSYMDRCDVFSLPSWNESFGIVYAEAMARGKPVIGCKGQGIEDIVEDGETGFLIEGKDEAGLSELLDRLLGDEQLRRRVGERAQQVIRERFTWEANVSLLKESYQKAIGHRTGGR